ncbi:hypothetical protein LAZ67_X002662 [Cordylochernes scorpioides]|uniref:PiggyBac transposable element-derived protein domain-containing protein n=1 Tax=Cordylochernes scorpioides TaxID=51811 RepID=A0ABY6LWS6_9ARAC|nr:hypothetical protein LAZ67_X002662 [Cordylochernes scorpioides]
MLSNADFLCDDNNIPNPDDEESETDDHIEEMNWSTDTEQYTLSEEENNEDPSFNYYIGKDQKTKWKKALPPKNVRTRSENIITHLPRVKGEEKNAKSILDCWKLFIDDNILECIVTNTNIYIRNIQQNYSRERDANLTNLHEIKALLGIIYFLVVMKANKLNTDDAWARDSTGFELCRIAMSENRFRFLLRVIRFDDKATRNERLRQDKLAAVRLILDTFVKNCQKHYSPSEYITVDEKLDAFRGKCNFRQPYPAMVNGTAMVKIEIGEYCSSGVNPTISNFITSDSLTWQQSLVVIKYFCLSKLKFVCLLKMTTDLPQIQKFNGDNFHLWKFQMKIILEAKDLLSINDGSEVKPEIEDIAKFSNWKKKDAKSKMLITTALEFKYLQQIVNCQT